MRWLGPTASQTANGAEAYQKTCAGCHGAKLQGGMGPAPVGKQFWLTCGDKKVLTLLDILAYLLQQNELAAGSQPLADTREISDILPKK